MILAQTQQISILSDHQDTRSKPKKPHSASPDLPIPLHTHYFCRPHAKNHKFSEVYITHYLFQMGTIESKIKQGYSVKQKPIIKRKSQKGMNPFCHHQSKSGVDSNESYFGSNETPLNRKKNSCPSSHEDTACLQALSDTGITASRFPSSAIGVIQSRLSNTIHRGIGALIASNIVLTSAHNLYSSKDHTQFTQNKFILNTGETAEIERIYVSQAYKNQRIGQRQCRETMFYEDYGVAVLKNHQNVEKCGLIGFDFNQSKHQVNAKIIVYRLQGTKKDIKAQGISYPAVIGQETISFDSYLSQQNSGGPILCQNDTSFVIIGLQNHLFTQKPSQQQSARLNQTMYNQISSWITQQEQQIDLRDKNLGKQGIKRLIKLKWTSLSSINISRNNIGPDGLKYFVQCEWNNLHHFDIGGNQIKKEGVGYLVKIPMKKLLSLNMGNSIGSEGIPQLLQADWKHLSSINLYNNNISNQGVKWLINANWQQLQTLNLGKNSINASVIPILKYCLWKDIVSLNIWGNGIKSEKDVLAQLNRYFPKIKYLYL